MSDHYGLGRLPAIDERDHNFPMAAKLAVEEVLPKHKYWRTGPVLNQGNTSSCVGHAWRGWLGSAPLMTKKGPDAFAVYNEAQKVDEWPGEEPTVQGTSVRAGAKVLQDLGHIQEYVWAEDVATLKRWVLTKGTVVLGTLWYQEMFAPQRLGYLWPNFSNEPVGGHAYLCVGYSTWRRAFRFLNSWSRSWGDNGRFWMHEEVVGALLRDQGEACAAIEKIL